MESPEPTPPAEPAAAAEEPGRRGRPLRLLVLYDRIYPQYLGGVEHRNLELARRLAERGHRVTLAGFSDTANEPFAGVEIRPLGHRRTLYTASGKRSTRQALQFAAAVARLDVRPFDLVETANIPYVHLFPLALRCALGRKPLLVTWHEYWGHRYWRQYLGGKGWIYAVVERICAHLGRRTAAVSRLTQERVAARRSSDSVELVPNGLETAALVAAARAGAAAAGESPPLIYAGRLQAEKRVDLLLRAVQRLAADFAGPLLTVIGDGPERRRLEGLARELDLGDQVRFLGRLPENTDVWRQLGAARIAVQPSSREGFGIFPLEAMAAGLPVVYCESPESAVSELVEDGVHGVASAADPAALASALGGLLGDEARRRRMGRRALEHAAEFDWSNIVRRLEELMWSMVGDPGACV